MNPKNIYRFVILCFITTLAMSACKKQENNNEAVPVDEMTNIAAVVNTQEGAALTFSNSMQSGKDSLDAFIDMANWVLQQPDVNKAFVTNASVLRIEYKNGLEGFIVTSATDAQGNSYERGGSGGRNVVKKDGGLRNLFGTLSNNIIENKKVLVFSPFFSPQFDYDVKLASGKIQLEATQVDSIDADLTVINTFKDYGLVVINSHGLPQGFMIMPKLPRFNVPRPPDGTTYTHDELREMFIGINGLPLDKFINGELSITKQIYYHSSSGTVNSTTSVLVRDKYIRNLPAMNHTVVFGNFCYSGYTFLGPDKWNTSEAFKSIGADAYYGYAFPDGSSAIVPNPWAFYMEDSLITNLIDGDSTGIAHLSNNISLQNVDGISMLKEAALEVEANLNQLNRNGLVFQPRTPALDFAFRQFFDPTYSYGCGTFSDPRDGEIYQLLCAGNKRWFAENLRYNEPGSTTVDSSTVNLQEFGRLYNYQMVAGGFVTCNPNQPGNIKGVCPQGWHVANHYDLFQLRDQIQYSSLTELSTRLKSGSSLWQGDPELNRPYRNSSGFNAYPTGYAYKNSFPATNFLYLDQTIGKFWLSSTLSQTPSYVSYVNIYGESGSTEITWDWEQMIDASLDKSYLPCRCVED